MLIKIKTYSRKQEGDAGAHDASEVWGRCSPSRQLLDSVKGGSFRETPARLLAGRPDVNRPGLLHGARNPGGTSLQVSFRTETQVKAFWPFTHPKDLLRAFGAFCTISGIPLCNLVWRVTPPRIGKASLAELGKGGAGIPPQVRLPAPKFCSGFPRPPAGGSPATPAGDESGARTARPNPPRRRQPAAQ